MDIVYDFKILIGCVFFVFDDVFGCDDFEEVKNVVVVV